MRPIIYVIIVEIIFGLVTAGLFLKLRRMLKKKSPHSHLVLFGLYMCMMVFVMFTYTTVIGILESFYSIWIAGSTAVGVGVFLIIVLFRLLAQELKKYKDLPVKGRDD